MGNFAGFYDKYKEGHMPGSYRIGFMSKSKIAQATLVERLSQDNLSMKRWNLESIRLAQRNLIEKVKEYATGSSLRLIREAFARAVYVHNDRAFPDGELYITHEIRLAYMLAEWKMSGEMIAAALSHNMPLDVIPPGIRGKVKSMRDILGFRYIPDKGRDQKLRCFNAMIRSEANLDVHLLAIADVIQTLISDAPRAERTEKEEYAEKALEVISPFLKYLGFDHLAGELEDLAFFHLNPKKFSEYQSLLSAKIENIEYLRELERRIMTSLEMMSIGVMSSVRSKGVLSSYKKIEVRGKKEIKDASGLRFIMNSEGECYIAANMISRILEDEGWTYDKDSSYDFMAMPKANGYRSIHLKFFREGIYLEIQIRTEEMDFNAEFGSASHWAYKHPDIPVFIVDSRSAKERFKAIRQSVIDEGMYYILDESGVIHEVIVSDPTLKPSVHDYALAAHQEGGVHLARAYILTGGEWRDIGLESSLNSGDTVKVVLSRDAVPTESTLEQLNSPLGFTIAKLWLQSPTKSKTRLSQTARSYITAGRDALSRQLVEFEQAALDRMRMVIGRMQEDDMEFRVLYSAEDMAARMGLRSEKELYLSIGISEDPIGAATDAAKDLMKWYMTVSYRRAEIRRRAMKLFLLYRDKTGLFLQLAEALRASDMNLRSLHMEHSFEGFTRDPLVLQGWEVSFGSEKSFNDLLRRLEHVYAETQSNPPRYLKNPVMLQINIAPDMVDSVGLAAKLAEAIGSVGAHILGGDIGPFRSSTLRILLPFGNRDNTLRRLEEALNSLEETESVHFG